MFLAGTNACSTTGRLASSLSAAAPVSPPIRRARDEKRSGDRGESMAACAGGMCSTNVEYWPLRPRSLACSATGAPPDMTVTRESESLTSTCSPISRKGTG